MASTMLSWRKNECEGSNFSLLYGVPTSEKGVRQAGSPMGLNIIKPSTLDKKEKRDTQRAEKKKTLNE